MTRRNTRLHELIDDLMQKNIRRKSKYDEDELMK